MPAEIDDHVEILIESGFRAIEIPLNSPDPFRSIERAVRRAEFLNASDMLVGAGTVLSIDQVATLHGIGANLVVSPNINCCVVKKSAALGMVSLPGVMTPSEAFRAIEAGATALKLFPADQVGPGGLRAMKAVLPVDIDVLVVGGVGAHNYSDYAEAGAAGLGVGTALFQHGITSGELRSRAMRIVAEVN